MTERSLHRLALAVSGAWAVCALAAPTHRVPQAPLTAPRDSSPVTLPDPRSFHRDADHLEAGLADRLRHAGPEEKLRIEVVLERAPTQPQLDAFVKSGGTLLWVFQSVSHGFWAEVSTRELRPSVRSLGLESVRVVLGDTAMVHDLDKATLNARARPVWKAGFAGSTAGFNGDANTTIGVIDTGIDATHPDVVGRMMYWRDFEGTSANPDDFDGHGTCVSSIAFGTGAAFEASKPTLQISRPGQLKGFIPGSYPGRAPLTFGTAATNLHIKGVFDGTDDARVAISSSGPASGGTRSYSTYQQAAGPSPIELDLPFSPRADQVFSVGVSQNDGGTIDWSVALTEVESYPLASDGLPTFRGMAPGCKWAVAHAADDLSTVEMALDDLMSQREAIALKLINLSQSPDDDGGITGLPSKLATMSENGVLVVKSAGNLGRSPTNPFITPSGRVPLVLTVGATNVFNQLTSYTSVGLPNPLAGEDLKPDLLAPGGSLLGVDMLCADSNSSDSPDGGIPDQVPNDYLPDEGTSFATPIVAGAAALVIQGLEAQGESWDFHSPASVKKVKSVLLATSTETNQLREAPPSPNPPVGRSAKLKDNAEGYGVLNVDAALEAITETLTLPWTGLEDGGTFDRRAWARKVVMTPDASVDLALGNPLSGDFDVYLFSGQSDDAGNPILLAAGDTPDSGTIEHLHYQPTGPDVGMVVVKRMAGTGTWTLVPDPICGNGLKELGEACDEATVCCTTTCTPNANGTICDGGSCEGGACTAPKCGDNVVVAPEECDDGNLLNGDCCSSTCRNETEGAPCTGGICASGVCTPLTRLDAVGDGGVESAPLVKTGCGCGTTDGFAGLLALALWAVWMSRRQSAVVHVHR